MIKGGQEGFYDQCRYYYETLIREDPDRDILIIGPDSKPGYHELNLCEGPDRDILIIGPDSKSG